MATVGVVIIKTGYLPFGEGVGYHRALFVNIQLISVLGTKLRSIKPARSRKLKLQDPRIRKKYNRALKHFFKKHNLKQRACALQQRAFTLSSTDSKEYKTLNGIRIQGMKYAEKGCKKSKIGCVPWTPELT